MPLRYKKEVTGQETALVMKPWKVMIVVDEEFAYTVRNMVGAGCGYRLGSKDCLLPVPVFSDCCGGLFP